MTLEQKVLVLEQKVEAMERALAGMLLKTIVEELTQGRPDSKSTMGQELKDLLDTMKKTKSP